MIGIPFHHWLLSMYDGKRSRFYISWAVSFYLNMCYVVIMEEDFEDFEEVEILPDGEPLEGYSSPGDVQRIRVEFIVDYLRMWEGVYVSKTQLLKALACLGATIELDNEGTGAAQSELNYLDYQIDSASIDPISLTRYKISRGLNEI